VQTPNDQQNNLDVIVRIVFMARILSYEWITQILLAELSLQNGVPVSILQQTSYHHCDIVQIDVNIYDHPTLQHGIFSAGTPSLALPVCLLSNSVEDFATARTLPSQSLPMPTTQFPPAVACCTSRPYITYSNNASNSETSLTYSVSQPALAGAASVSVGCAAAIGFAFGTSTRRSQRRVW
jgi:hypothetical protein